MYTNKVPKISVIIPVRNETRNIENCLNALFEQSLIPFEIIIVDGHSADDTIEKVNRYNVRIFTQTSGACAFARQIGLDNSKGDYIAFTDADCIPSKNWLLNLVNNFDNEVVGVGGSIKNIGKGLWINSTNLAQNTFLGGGTSIQTRLYNKKKFVKSISASNSMYLRSDLKDVGGFNILLSGADEAELNDRLTRIKKKKLLYIPEAQVIHNHGRGLQEFVKTMYLYGRFRKECGIWDLPSIPPIIVPLILLTLIFSKWVFVSLAIIYLLIIIFTGFMISIHQKDCRYLVTIPIVYIAEHGAFSVGFWREILYPRRKI